MGLHSNARPLYIQNLVLGVTFKKKKIALLRDRESSSDVKTLVMVNSQAIAGAENYGLLVTKGLFNLGFDVQFCTPSEANVFPEGLRHTGNGYKKGICRFQRKLIMDGRVTPFGMKPFLKN